MMNKMTLTFKRLKTFLLILGMTAGVSMAAALPEARAQSFESSIQRAEELISKGKHENLSATEQKELNNLITAAKRTPANRRTESTNKLLNNYNKYEELSNARQTLETAQKNYNDWTTQASSDKAHDATTSNIQGMLAADVKAAELQVQRANEDLNAVQGKVGDIFRKKQELEDYKNQNRYLLLEDDRASASITGALTYGQQQNMSGDVSRKQQIKTAKDNIKKMEAELKKMEGDLSASEKAEYEQRREEDQFLNQYKNGMTQISKLQQKYCGDKQPPECDWKTKATTYELQDVRNSKDETVTSVPGSLCGKSCAPSCYYSEIQGECLLCGMFKKAFNVSSEVAARSIQTFSGSIMNLVVMVFALWIVVKVLAFVSSPETRDIKDLTQELVQQSFFVVFVIILLKTGGMSFFNMALNPVFQTGMTIAQRTITADDAAGWQAEGSNYSCDRSGILTQKDGGALPEKMGESIVCTMTLIQDRASKIKALGTASICYSWKKKLFVIPHWGYFMTGVGLWVGGMLLILAVPFFMLDSVVQLAVASALLPMAIGAYAFKITRGYVKPVWETFMNSMFVFIFVCLIALMLTKAYETVLLSASQGDLNLNDMLRAGTEANLEQMLQKFSWFDVAFLKVCFILILSWSVIGEAKSFAGNFSGSLSNTNYGSQIGTMAGSATKSAVKSLTKPTREAIGDAAWKMPGRAVSGISHYGRRGLMSYQAYKIKKRGSGAVAEDGSRTFTDRRGNSVTEFADGSRSVKTVRSERGFMGLGKKKGEIVKFKNEHFSITRSDVRDKNGNVIGTKERIRLNSSESENLINKKGVLDRERYDSLLNSGQGEMAEMVKIATAKKLAADQIANLRINLENHDYTRQTATYDDNGNFTGYTETHRDGSRTIVKLQAVGERMMTEVTRVSASGQGIRLSTDGIITRKQAFVTDNGKADGNIDESSIRSRYGLTQYYAQQHVRRRYKKVDYNASLFSAEEVTNAKNFMASRTTYNEATLDEFRTY